MIYINPEMSKQQALILNALLQRTIAHANAISPKDALYDLQGRMLFLLPAMGPTPASPFEAPTLVSFDVRLSPVHYEALYQRLGQHLEASNLNPTPLIECLKATNCGSMIALTQEFYFHLSLATAIYGKAFSSHFSDPSLLKQAQNEAMLRLECSLFQTVADGLLSAFDAHTIDVGLLNQTLDRARPRLMRLAHLCLRDAIVSHCGNITPAMLKATDLLPIARQTSATAYPMLHLDLQNGLCLWIEGSTETAHERRHGPHFAHRQLITSFIDQDKLSPHPRPRVQIRTPTPVIKRGATDDGFIEDACVKLEQFPCAYSQTNALISDKIPPQFDAFIYHQLTALHDKKGDKYNNLQTQSARHVLLGAHRYNRLQLEKPARATLCLVQGICVNGFGVTLGYTNDMLQREQTLMCELALLYTLYPRMTKPDQKAVDSCFEHYLQFLKAGASGFFSSTPLGVQTIDAIQAHKPRLIATQEDDLASLAYRALLVLFKANYHMSHRWAKLIQALSIFLCPFSAVGCKSGNERTQAINGRVGVLDLLYHPLLGQTPPLIAIKGALERVGREHDLQSSANALKERVDGYYNDRLLQTGYGLISLADQGATAKLTPKTRHPFKRFNRNQAEEPPKIMRYLSQVYAGQMQAHHQMTKEMVRSFRALHRKEWLYRLLKGWW